MLFYNKMKMMFFLIATSLALAENAHGQICSMSHYPYGWGMMNRPVMHGSKFKAVSKDLPFIDVEKRQSSRYAQFWVRADVLNVRSGPGLSHAIISETYYGNLVFAQAKQGDWVAIRRGLIIEDIDVMPRWLHMDYLSSNPINEQIETHLLKAKCDFAAHGTYLSNIKDFSVRLSNIYNPCGSVRNYLSHQQLLGKPHNYVQEYGLWRRSQKNPEMYSPPSCQKS